ncbi:LOW QUALITY PROTEIN: hypothetical protein YC2023_011479 [Brassica napus]
MSSIKNREKGLKVWELSYSQQPYFNHEYLNHTSSKTRTTHPYRNPTDCCSKIGSILFISNLKKQHYRDRTPYIHLRRELLITGIIQGRRSRCGTGYLMVELKVFRGYHFIEEDAGYHTK